MSSVDTDYLIRDNTTGPLSKPPVKKVFIQLDFFTDLETFFSLVSLFNVYFLIGHRHW